MQQRMRRCGCLSQTDIPHSLVTGIIAVGFSTKMEGNPTNQDVGALRGRVNLGGMVYAFSRRMIFPLVLLTVGGITANHSIAQDSRQSTAPAPSNSPSGETTTCVLVPILNSLGGPPLFDSIHRSPQPRTLRSLLAITLIEYALKRDQYPPPAHQALGTKPFKIPSRTTARVRTFRPRGET